MRAFLYYSALNQFRKGIDTYYEPYYQRDGDYEDFSDDRIRHYNQEDYTIAQMLADKGKHVVFEYDFGDSWEHEVTLSSVDEYKDGEARVIRFVSGKRACPPEDCGGIWGYEELSPDKIRIEENEKEFNTVNEAMYYLLGRYVEEKKKADAVIEV